MGTLRSAVLSFTSNTGGFNKGIKDSQQILEEFNNKANGTKSGLGALGSSFDKVEINARSSKEVLNSVSGAMGETGNAAGSLVANVIRMGPALGLATAAFELYSNAQKEAAKNAEEFKKIQEFSNETLKQTNLLSGITPHEGPYGAEERKNIDDTQKKLDELYALRQKDDEAWISNAFTFSSTIDARIAGYDKEIDKLHDIQSENARLNLSLRTINDATKDYNKALYEGQVASKIYGVDGLGKELDATTAYAKKLAGVLAQLPEGGLEYEKVQKLYQQEYLKELGLLDQIKQKNKSIEDEAAKAAKEKQKEQDKINEAIQKQIDNENEVAKKRTESIKESLLTPAEEFKKKIQEAYELRDKLGEDFFNRDIEKLKSDFANQTQKQIPRANLSAGLIDTSLINLSGLRKSKEVQETHSAQLDTANQLLQEVVNNTADGGATFQ